MKPSVHLCSLFRKAAFVGSAPKPAVALKEARKAVMLFCDTNGWPTEHMAAIASISTAHPLCSDVSKALDMRGFSGKSDILRPVIVRAQSSSRAPSEYNSSSE